MSAYIHYEMLLFLQSAALGAALLLCYDLLTGLRRVIAHSTGAVAAEDLLYWLGTGLFVFTRVYQSNQGILRSFLFLGMLLGAVLCHGLVSPFFVKLWAGILTIPVMLLKKFIKRLLFLRRRCKILMSESAERRMRQKKGKSLRAKRGRRIEKVEKEKQYKKNRV